MCWMTGGLSMTTRRPSTIAVSALAARRASWPRALENSASSLARRALALLTWARNGLTASRIVSSVMHRVPHVDQPHIRVPGHPVAIRTDGGHGRRSVVGGTEAIGATRDHDAGCEPFDIPFPGCRQGLVKVVRIEHEPTFRRREQAEVAHMGVAAGLHDDVGPRRGGEIERHHRRGPAEVGERRLRHARMAQRHQVRQSIGLLEREDGHRVAARARLEGRLAGTRNALAFTTALVDAR